MRTIQMKCSRCGGTLFLEREKGFVMLSCPYCGGTMNLLTESDRVKIAAIRANTDRFGMALSYKKHRDYLAMEWLTHNAKYLLATLGVIIVLILIATNTASSGDNIRIPFSSNDLSKKNCQDAKTMFLDDGFSDIEFVARKDLWDGFLHNDQKNIGKVAQVTINGDEKFRENDRYDKTAKIRIWYHDYP